MKLFIKNQAEEIRRNVGIILETPKYSCPLNRDLGLNAVFLDMPVASAQAAMRAEIAEQVEKYEPRAKVKAIAFELDPKEGVIKPRVILEI